MAAAVEDILGPRLDQGLVILPEGIECNLRSRVFHAAKNNLPDEDSVNATNALIEFLEKNDSTNTVIIFLISGGGSALLCSPVDDLTLQDKLQTIHTLTSHGADIHSLNTVRHCLSKVKGGKLLQHVPKSTKISLIVSDVIGNDVEIIASGPTVIPTTKRNAKEIIDSLKVTEKTDSKPDLKEHHFVISNNVIALESVENSLKTLGYNTCIMTSELSGNVTEVGIMMADFINSEKTALHEKIRRFRPDSAEETSYPLALIFGGETTVTIKGQGKGGRNQEMVLQCLERVWKSSPKHRFVFLSAGTDGQDGPTDAAGAVITSEDLPEDNLSPNYFLSNSDSYSFWNSYQNGSCHLKTGKTGTNVMDVQILILDVVK
ncbi:unnamed protein product [Caenorhabditis auriculariae]|uniref:MOFRL-associated domain-containing protein n=1 Tax=Caenorhabditis auriculariae TaxID=2777116 RepID=A0A8S1GZN0_9PELO|nr:unnamed protein product [Caenorhabditis auriculariae]